MITKVKEAAIRALERRGKVDPLELIEAARAENHPCHNDFTWDIEQAAQERWRDQARELIRACKFEVIVEDVGQRVVRYVADGEAEHFLSLPKIRSATTNTILLTELRMLAGSASRVYGIALAKQNMVGADACVRLGAIRDQVTGLIEEMEAE